jgi:putative transposase
MSFFEHESLRRHVMAYDPKKHHRRSIRLRGYDYAQEGEYFVTICTFERECVLGEIKDGTMRLSSSGEIAKQCWDEIPRHFENVELGEFVIMPNHLHGVILLPGIPRGDEVTSTLPNVSEIETRRDEVTSSLQNDSRIDPHQTIIKRPDPEIHRR